MTITLAPTTHPGNHGVMLRSLRDWWQRRRAYRQWVEDTLAKHDTPSKLDRKDWYR